MSAPTVYSAASREISPITKLLEAVVEINWHRSAAGELGWEITLATNDGGDLTVSVFRDTRWPSESSETEAAEGAK